MLVSKYSSFDSDNAEGWAVPRTSNAQMVLKRVFIIFTNKGVPRDG